MNLTDVKKDAYYIIESILYNNELEEKNLNNYGLVIGEKIKLLNVDSMKKAYFICIGENQFYVNSPLALRIGVIDA